MSEEIVRKTYLSPIIGSGTHDDQRRPKIADLPLKCSWFMHELGKTSFCLCVVVASLSEHDKIALDSEVKLIATRKEVQLSEGDLTVLRGQYADFDVKFETVKKCWIRFKEETGE